MKKFVKILGGVISVPIVLFALFLLAMTWLDYKPEPIEQINQSVGEELKLTDTLRIFNWNIGYSGLGDDMSFFYDGGDKVRTTKERTSENLKAIIARISLHADSTDIFLLQEVDLNAKRSYKTNQLELIHVALNDYNKSFAYNYKVAFVPVPMSDPFGKINGGLATFSKYEPYDVKRYSFEGNYAWPKSLLLLDRCFMVHRYHTSNNKELLVINTHNSAYDDGSLRLRQMKMMKSFLIQEYEKGNYILVGGDWNQEPPIAENSAYSDKRGHLTNVKIASDFMPEEWSWVYNSNAPTNRLIDEEYNPITTKTSVIDFFLLSPNLKSVYSQNINLEFQNSDHNPVFLSVVFDE